MIALYRHFDIDGKLLYVGISLSALQRFLAHRCNSQWAGQIATMKIEQCTDIAEARVRERVAIESEKPLWNIQHNNKKTTRWSKKYGAWKKIFAKLEESGNLYAIGSPEHIDSFTTKIDDLEAEYQTPKSMCFQNKQIKKAIECLRSARDHYQMGGRPGQEGLTA